MATRCVAFYSANAAIVDIINRQSSKHPLVMLFGFVIWFSLLLNTIFYFALGIF